MTLTEEHRIHFWENFHRVMREARYQELLSEIAITRLASFHRGLSFGAGICATGSPIAGLSLWETGGGRAAWAGLTLLAAAAAYVLGFSDAPDRIKREERSRQKFMEIRITAENSFRSIVKPADLRPTTADLQRQLQDADDALKAAMATTEVSAFQLVLCGAKKRARTLAVAWLTEMGYSLPEPQAPQAPRRPLDDATPRATAAGDET